MDTLIEAPLWRKAKQLVDARGRQQLTTGQHYRCRHQPGLHLEDICEEEMEEGSRIGLTDRPPGYQADGERDERENDEGKGQPGRIRAAGCLETAPLAHANSPWGTGPTGRGGTRHLCERRGQPRVPSA